jgi:predicted Zn-dependent protease
MNRRILQTMASLLLTILLNETLMSQGTTGKNPKNSDIENIGKRDINKGQTNFTSLNAEIKIGQSAASEVERDTALVEDSEINGYVDPHCPEHCETLRL